jgi:hypothetical protein
MPKACLRIRSIIYNSKILEIVLKRILIYLIYYLRIINFLILTSNKSSFYYFKRLLI